jgi:predicted ATPase/signal transduction histidine kinase/GAF domain-containing protein
MVKARQPCRKNNLSLRSTGDALAVRSSAFEEQDELARDERFVLCRARRASDGAAVLLKRPVESAAAAADAQLLEREFELLRSLPVEPVTRPIAFCLDAGRATLVLEDHGARTLAALARESAPPLGWVLDYAVQLATVLAELHRCGVVHRGLRPQAVLVEGPARRIRLWAFSDAARSPAEAAIPLSPRLYRSRLAYAAPEQTGRIGHACDHRSDFYSLGVLLYELLCGRLPFDSADPLAVIHAHVARIPPAPAEIDPLLPLPLSQIVMKLLAKAPEERYQSDQALQRDLMRCRQEWSRHGRVLPFEIGARDVPAQFAVPRRLYGRDAERAQVGAAFERARQGRARLLLVAGYAGVGKTALIQELHEPAVRSQGLFVSGKFDQLSGDAPYRALTQALRQLVQRALAEPAPQLAQRRQRLIQAIGDNVATVAALIPELTSMLGGPGPLPPSAMSLPPAEAHNRLTRAFGQFIASQASADQPLVLFLDDLQWADAGSLQLLESMLASPSLQHLLLVGAYRDNEVEPGHRLLASVAALHDAGVPIDRIDLAPLALPALTQLTADSLHVEPDAAAPLAELLLAKTAGNPFFTTQFLMSLHRDGLIAFDAERASWGCRLDRVAAAATTDNVADLMSRKIDRLAPVTRSVLTLAACVGHRFDARTVAVVSEQGLQATLSDLADAALEGLITAEDENTFVFLHDRVQQAAYARIAPERRPQVHLSVGRLMLAQRQAGFDDEQLFDIVSHLNLGAALIESRAERLDLARLNLNAGRQARLASAFGSALAYFKAGLALLNDTHWHSHHELAFALWFEAAQCEYLGGHFAAAEQAMATLLQHAVGALDRARVFSLRMVQQENMARYADALASAREGLALFDITLPEDDAHKHAALEREIKAIEAAIGTRTIESLIELPTMHDDGMRMVMAILTDIWSPAYILGDAVLARLISARLVRLTLQYGQCEESAYGYVTHAITVGPVRRDYEAAYAFGALALQVNQRFDDRRRRAKIQQQFHAHVNLWCRPMQSCIAYAKQACCSGLASGDFLYAAYGASTESWPAIVSCQNLGDCVRSLEPNLALVVTLRNTAFADALRMVMSWARALQGGTDTPLSLSHAEGDGFDEAAYAETYRDNPFFSMFHAIAQLHIGYMLDDAPQALAALRAVRRSAHQLAGMIWSVLFDFWGGLTLAANLDRAADAAEREDWLVQMRESQTSLAVLARSCAVNFRCHALLLDAELERIGGRQEAALDRYEQAIAQADDAGSVQQQALANELFAKFWLGRGNRGIAALYLRAALAHYRAWGAQAKVRQMIERHVSLLGPAAAAPRPAAAIDSNLDLATIVKAAHAIAETSELERLLERLLQIAIENAGARRGLLIEEADGVLRIVAEGSSDGSPVTLLQGTPIVNESARCSRAVVDYVWRTRASLVIDDATADERFADDAYVAAARLKSVLCLPIVHQGEVSAMLYLENDLARDAFDPQRIELIEILMAQGSISLANARLAHRMRQEMSERQRAEDTLRAIESGTAAVTGADFFRALVRNLAHALGVRYAFVAECCDGADGAHARARMRAFWKGDRFGSELEYETRGTPCSEVLEGKTCHHAQDVQALFPEDESLAWWGAKSYLGMPLLGSTGEVIGHMAVLDSRVLADASVATSVMSLCAGRAGAELERLKAAEGQQRALAEVQVLKNRLQEENVYLRRELIANVSHDLRSPLASLRGYLETLLLKEQALSESERRSYLEIALRQSQHLQTLISELFELARLDFEGYRIDAEPVQLGELARDVAQKLGLAAQTRHVELDLDIEPELGLARADIGLIERTLTNLIENALAHTPAGGRIVLSMRAQGACIALCVADNGSGIAAHDLPRIFERFYRADKARTRDDKGSGLGLAIVKRIVELHGSEIRVDSAVGRGTRVGFDLPLA